MNDELPFQTFNKYLKARFGQRVQRIPVHAGMTCPNRDGTVDTIFELTEFSEIYHIRASRDYPLPEKQDAGPEKSGSRDMSWAIVDSGAEAFWAEFGKQGQGIIIAEIGTGVEYSHPALIDAFKCTDPSDPACWEDPANICGGTMCDNIGYSTSNMGVLVGADSMAVTHRVGIAPGAKWITCKGCEYASCSEASLNACADWVLAPDENPANRPHVVVCGWAGGGGDNWYQANVQAWRAAGIFPAFMSGNSGDSCSTLSSPGDYQESFQCAAHDSVRDIASFSSRGPSVYGYYPYTKPNISAPGYDVLTTAAGAGWTTMSGTNVSACVAGASVALL